jgi:hypothetical protein
MFWWVSLVITLYPTIESWWGILLTALEGLNKQNFPLKKEIFHCFHSFWLVLCLSYHFFGNWNTIRTFSNPLMIIECQISRLSLLHIDKYNVIHACATYSCIIYLGTYKYFHVSWTWLVQFLILRMLCWEICGQTTYL